MTHLDTRGMSVGQLVEKSGEPSLSAEDSRKVGAEINRRLIEALNASNESTEKYNKVLITLTVVLVIIGLLPLIKGSEHTSRHHGGNGIEIYL